MSYLFEISHGSSLTRASTVTTFRPANVPVHCPLAKRPKPKGQTPPPSPRTEVKNIERNRMMHREGSAE